MATGFLTKFLGQRKSAAELGDALTEAKERLRATRAQMVETETRRHSLLLDGSDADIRAVDEDINRLGIEEQRLEAAAEAIEARIEAAKQAAHDDHLQAMRKHALRLVEHVRARYPDYTKFAQAIADIAAEERAADIEVRRVNELLTAEGLEPVERIHLMAPAREGGRLGLVADAMSVPIVGDVLSTHWPRHGEGHSAALEAARQRLAKSVGPAPMQPVEAGQGQEDAA
ncbi:MAG: hypothetical protein RLO50_14475 [Azospirillaceae bacterium]